MKRSPLIITALLAVLLLSAGCTQSSSLTVKLSDHPSIGTILTDSNGRALYFLAKDVPGTGKATELGESDRYYPPFYAENVVSSPGIAISDFGYLTRPDGKKQTTYRGWPLYYYFNDRNAGDLKLDTASNVWFAIRPDFTLMVGEKDNPGLYLTDATGKALYVFGNGSANSTVVTPDMSVPTPSVKNETGRIPFYTDKASGPTVLNLRDFGVTKRLDGTKQSTWRGMPLAYSTADKLPGDTLGEGSGWSLVKLAPAVSIASFGNLTVPGQTLAQNQTTRTPATTVTTTEPTTVRTTEPTTMATSATSTYVIPAYPVSNGDGSVSYPVTVTTTQPGTGSLTPNTSQTIVIPTGPVVVTTETVKPATTATTVTTVTTIPVTTRTLPTQVVVTTTPPTQPVTTLPSTPQTTVPPVPTQQTTVPSLPTLPVTTVPQPVIPVTVQTTIPIPLPI